MKRTEENFGEWLNCTPEKKREDEKERIQEANGRGSRAGKRRKRSVFFWINHVI